MFWNFKIYLKRFGFDVAKSFFKKWQEAEEKTFKECLIFEIIE